MSEEQAIRVNFGRPMPIFPLAQPVLLPQQVLPLHVFEPRYRQMVEVALDGPGQIAMAVFQGNGWRDNYEGSPDIRPAVCVGQIVQHQKLDDGRYNVFLQGVCRARIVDELLPEAEAHLFQSLDTFASLASLPRLYREAMLEPIGLHAPDAQQLATLREYVEQQLATGPLAKLGVAPQVLKTVRNEDIPSEALIELVAFALLTEPTLRYALLEETDSTRRLALIQAGLRDLAALIARAVEQHPERWPKGLSWN